MSKEIPNKGTICVVSPGFNCEHQVRIWYNSLRIQSYKNWIAYAIDDCSEDNTSYELHRISLYDERVKLIRRKKHYYQLGNWFDIIHNYIGSGNLVVRLDLDDWLGSKYVFETIIKEHIVREVDVFTITEHCLSTYYDDNVSARWMGKTKRDVLEYKWTGDSLFCFLSDYFLKIPVEMFLDDKNWFVRCAGDIAITFPIFYQGIEKIHHLYIPNGLMYDDIRPECLNDDNLKTEDGKRLQFYWGDIFKERFLKDVNNLVYD